MLMIYSVSDVTVANRSGVCTNALSDGVALDQIVSFCAHTQNNFMQLILYFKGQ